MRSQTEVVEEAGREAVSTTTFCDGGGNGELLDMMTEERSPEPSLQVLPGFLVVSVPLFSSKKSGESQSALEQ
jgi:hypothetical protein